MLLLETINLLFSRNFYSPPLRRPGLEAEVEELHVLSNTEGAHCSSLPATASGLLALLPRSVAPSSRSTMYACQKSFIPVYKHLYQDAQDVTGTRPSHTVIYSTSSLLFPSFFSRSNLCFLTPSPPLPLLHTHLSSRPYLSLTLSLCFTLCLSHSLSLDVFFSHCPSISICFSLSLCVLLCLSLSPLILTFDPRT